MLRHEWKPIEINTKINIKLLNLINKSLVYCGQSTIYIDCEHWQEIREKPFTHTWLKIADTDQTKISGMSYNVLQSKAWLKYEDDNQCDLEYFYRCAAIYDPPSNSFREEKGNYIKAGKLISWLLPHLSSDAVSCISHKLTDLLRNGAVIDTSVLKITDNHIKPSDIYTMLYEDKNTLGSSCMGNQGEDRFKLYDDNNWQLLYMIENGLLVGRAFIHDNVKDKYDDDNNYKIMDRIYVSDIAHESIFKKYAKDNGYYHKIEQRLSVNEYINPITGEKEYLDKLYVECLQLEDRGYKEVPYIDTFAYYSPSEGKLYCVWSDDIETDLHNTDGNDSERIIVDSKVCYDCDCRLSRDTSYVYDERVYCENCYNERFGYCENCDSTVESNELQYIESEEQTICDHCLQNYFTQCDYCNEYHRDTLPETEDTGRNYCENCIDKIIFCSECGDAFQHSFNLMENDDDELLCSQCFSAFAKQQFEDELVDNDDTRSFKWELSRRLSKRYELKFKIWRDKYNEGKLEKYPDWLLAFNGYYTFIDIGEI